MDNMGIYLLGRTGKSENRVGDTVGIIDGLYTPGIAAAAEPVEGE